MRIKHRQNNRSDGLRTYTVWDTQNRNNAWGHDFYSVTTVLSVTESQEKKEGLIRWREGLIEKHGDVEGSRLATAGASRGTALHKWCEDYLAGDKPNFNDPDLPGCKDALPFWESMKPALERITDVKYQEQFVYNPDFGYSGTLDCYATFDGIENTLIDFKTSNKPKRFDWIQDYCLQTVAYAAAVKHVFGHGTNQAAILISLPDRPAQVFTLCYEEMEYYWELWEKRLGKFDEKIKSYSRVA
jgi:hypothetical protein